MRTKSVMDLVAHEISAAPGKLPGMREFTNVYFDMSKGGEVRSPRSQGPQ